MFHNKRRHEPAEAPPAPAEKPAKAPAPAEPQMGTGARFTMSQHVGCYTGTEHRALMAGEMQLIL